MLNVAEVLKETNHEDAPPSGHRPRPALALVTPARVAFDLPVTLDGAVALGRQAATMTIERAKFEPLPRRRGAQRERDWIADLVSKCVRLRANAFIVYDRLPFGIRYQSDYGMYGRIAVASEWMRDRSVDVDHDVAAMLSFWAWRHLLKFKDGWPEFVFSNAFANALLGRGSRAFDSLDEIPEDVRKRRAAHAVLFGGSAV